MMDDLCINGGVTHASSEPLTFSELLALYWLGDLGVSWVAGRTLRRQAARELGLPAPRRKKLRRRYPTYRLLVQSLVILLLPVSLLLRVIFRRSPRDE